MPKRFGSNLLPSGFQFACEPKVTCKGWFISSSGWLPQTAQRAQRTALILRSWAIAGSVAIQVPAPGQ